MKRIRTPARIQMEATECGAASLAIILEHFGTFVPLSKLREECGVSRDGSKASNVLKAARAYGLEAKGYRKEPHELAALGLPLIVHWKFGHFLVVEGFDHKRAYLNDPASGPTSVTLAEFDESFTGVVLAFKPTEDYRPGAGRPSVVAMLRGRLDGARGAAVFLALAGLGLLVPGLLVPVFGLLFVDEILVARQLALLPQLVLAMGASAALRAALVYLQRSYLLELTTALGVKLASGFVWHALRLPMSFYFARSPGDLARRSRANDAVARALSGTVANVALDALLVVFYGAFMLYLDSRLALVAFGAAFVHVALLRVAARTRTDLSRQLGEHGGKVAGVAASALQMIETIKATGSEAQLFAQVTGHLAKAAGPRQKLARVDQLLVVATDLLARVTTLSVLALGALRVMDGHFTLGQLVAFQVLTAGFLAPLESLSQVGALLQLVRTDLERLDDVVEHERDEQASREEPADDAPRVRLRGELELRGVSFGYGPFAPPIVRDIGLRITPGRRLALVGGTGSGKSTVARLVTALERPRAGEILFDGQPRAALSRRALSSSVAMVGQEAMLFEGTVRENLTLWDESVPEADVVAAAKDACIHDDVARLPGGYEAKVLEGGANFSGGQRQRLEIARALVRRPSLLVLDEATSALDAETEQRIDENLRRRGCSCLVIAHRLSTIRDADEIVVLDRGTIAERGSHAELFARGGLYRELVTSA